MKICIEFQLTARAKERERKEREVQNLKIRISGYSRASRSLLEVKERVALFVY